MATQNTRMLQRRDTSANWSLFNPILASGEVGYESDTGKMKLGDGTSNWVSLNYFTDVEYASQAEVIAGVENAKAVTPASGTEYLRKNATAQEIITGDVQFSTTPTTITDPTQDNEVPRKIYVDQQFTITAGDGGDAGKALRLDGSGKFPAAAIPSTSLPYATNGEADAGISQDTVINPAVGAHAYLRKNAGGTQTVNTQTDFVGNVLAQVTPSLNHHVTRLVDLNGRFQGNSFDTGSAFAGKGVILDADGKIDSLILPPITGTGTFLGSFDPETGAVIPGTLAAPVDGDPLREDGEYWVVAIASGATSWHWDFENGVPHPGPESGRIIELFIGDQVLYEDVSAIWHVAALGRGGAAGSYLPLNGSQPMSGNISMGGNQVNDATQVGGSVVIVCNGNSFHLDLGDLQPSEGVAGRNFLAIKNSNTTTERPASLASGEMAFNLADRTSYLGVAGTVHGMAAPRWSDGAQYKTWDVVSREGGVYIAIADSLDEDPLSDTANSFWFTLNGTPINQSTTIHVNDATGDDQNGNGTSGQPFKTIARGLQKVYTLVPTPNITITIDVAAGTYDSETIKFPGLYPFATRVSLQGVDQGAGNYITGMPHADFSTSHTAPTTSSPGVRDLRNTCGQLGTSATDITFDNALDQDRIDNDAFLRTQYQTVVVASAVAIRQQEGGPLIGEIKNILFTSFINPTSPVQNTTGLYIEEQNSGATQLSNVAFSGFTNSIYNVSNGYKVAASTFGGNPVTISGDYKSGVYLRNGGSFHATQLFIQGCEEYGVDARNAVIGNKFFGGLDLGPGDIEVSGCRNGGVHQRNSGSEFGIVKITGTRDYNIDLDSVSSLAMTNATLEGARKTNLIAGGQCNVTSLGTITAYGSSVNGIYIKDSGNLQGVDADIQNCDDIGIFSDRGAVVYFSNSASVERCSYAVRTQVNGNVEIQGLAAKDCVTADIFIEGGFGSFPNASLGQSGSTSPIGALARQGGVCVIDEPGTGNIDPSVSYSPSFGNQHSSGAWIGL